tara:strand:- start:1828 stop:1947 length:120 start_codon:yes stop_codon:yes gene_type:complete
MQYFGPIETGLKCGFDQQVQKNWIVRVHRKIQLVSDPSP